MNLALNPQKRRLHRRSMKGTRCQASSITCPAKDRPQYAERDMFQWFYGGVVLARDAQKAFQGLVERLGWGGGCELWELFALEPTHRQTRACERDVLSITTGGPHGFWRRCWPFQVDVGEHG